jgi:PAS domain S-box-containing protein
MRREDAGQDVSMGKDELNTKIGQGRGDIKSLDLNRLFRYTTENAPLGLVAVEGEHHIIRQVNPAFCRLVGKTKKELIGRAYADAVPEGQENGCVALLDRVYATREAESIAHQEHAGAGSGVYWSYTTWAILEMEERPAGVLLQVTDTTEPVRVQNEAKAVNEALLVFGVRQHKIAEIAVGLNVRLQRAMRETNHRVKNNLQVVSAMADIQMDIDSPTIPTSAMQRIAEHVRTLATLHDLLAEQVTGDVESDALDAQTVLHRLLPALQATIGARHIQYEIAPMMLPIHQCESLSLIVNELVSNIVKHGAGEICVMLQREQDTAVLTVRDEGAGFPPNFDPRESANTGLELILTMARHDLHGDVEFTNRPEGGASVVVTFPVAS